MSIQDTDRGVIHGEQTGADTRPLSSESFNSIRGLVKRDKQRLKLPRLVTEAPRVAYSTIVLNSRSGVIHNAKELLRSLISKPPHSSPPRAWYRLDSLGSSYRARQKLEPFTIQKNTARKEYYLMPPPSMADSLEQVIIVSQRLRLVLEIATRTDDGRWLMRGLGKRPSRHASFVFISKDGDSWSLPCDNI